jgi:hypothetical protein
VILLLAVGSAQAASPSAHIVSAKGTVQILAAPTGEWVAAASRAAVPPGSAVRTGPKSRAVIELDGATVTLYETSLIRIPAVAAPTSTATNPLRHPWLDSGRALFDVTPRKDRASFSVQTPTVVAGVKGTVFEMSSTGTEEAVYVWNGLVEVTSRLNSSDIQLVAAGQFTMLDDLRLTPALPIPDERVRPDEVDLHRHTAEAVDSEKAAVTERMTEDFSVGTTLESTLALTTEAWRDADRAAVKPALDQALDFQSVVSIGTVRISTDSLTNSLASTTTTVSDTTRTVTDPHTSTVSSVVDPLTSGVSGVVDPLTSTLAPVVSPVIDPLTSTLAPVVTPLTSTVSTVVTPLRILGF